MKAAGERRWLRAELEAASAERATIAYPQTLYQNLRITIHDEGQAALTIREAALLFDEIIPAQEDRWSSGPVEPTINKQAKTTTVRLELGVGRVPVSRIALRITGPASFVREAELELSDDGQEWYPVGHAILFQTPGASIDAPVEVAFREARGRYVRATIMNGDNPPIMITHAYAFGIRRSLLFPVTAGRSYWLYVGSEAPAPQYDLPQVLSREPEAPRPVTATLGPLEPNSAYVAPVVRRPWTGEHPALLWGILGVVVLVLALLIIGTARKTRTAP